MTIYQLDPLADSRWTRLVDRHSKASIFHTLAWLQSLRDTYGYEPIGFTLAPPGQELESGLVACRVRSWLTGSRLVSLPFSDHCEPLVDTPDQLRALIVGLEECVNRERLKYFELRPLSSDGFGCESYRGLLKSESYYFQFVDLRPDQETLFKSFHKSCVQRKVHRAERENLEYEEGRSEDLLKRFYGLMLITRKRHGLPPQPYIWFRNLIRSLNDKVEIRMVSKARQPVASIFTILHKKCLVYKYGCSDARFHNLGGMPFLFWRAIQEGQRRGAVEYDLGRSECDNEGLISFKDNWSATKIPLNYYRYPITPTSNNGSSWSTRVAKHAFSRMPGPLLSATGRILYRHIG